MFKPLFIAVKFILYATFLTGIIYPLTITILGQVFLSDTSNGQLILKNVQVIGSKLIGQNFTKPIYFHSRHSASGLDPHITIEDANKQIVRIARVRKLEENKIRKLIDLHTTRRFIFTEPMINVLEVNLELDILK